MKTPKVFAAVVLGLFVGCSDAQKERQLQSEVKKQEALISSNQTALKEKDDLTQQLEAQLKQREAEAKQQGDVIRAFQSKLDKLEEAMKNQQSQAVASRQPAAGPQPAPVNRQPQKMRVISFLVNYIGCSRCIVEFEGRNREVLIENQLLAIRDYFTSVSDNENYVKQTREKVESDRWQANQLNATALTGAGGNADYVDAAMAERKRANLAMVNVRHEQENLSEAESTLKHLKSQSELATTIYVENTGKTYVGLSIWRFLGTVGEVSQTVTR